MVHLFNFVVHTKHGMTLWDSTQFQGCVRGLFSAPEAGGMLFLWSLCGWTLPARPTAGGVYRQKFATKADCAGNVFSIPKAVCLHEEDAGMLWKHMDYRTGHAEVRRSRRLVLSFVSTVVNYEYAFYWYFYQVSPLLLSHWPAV